MLLEIVQLRNIIHHMQLTVPQYDITFFNPYNRYCWERFEKKIDIYSRN